MSCVLGKIKMKSFESVDCVLDFAIEQEIAAQKFYLDLAEKIAVPQMKEVFENFAREEKGHQLQLEQLKSSGSLAQDLEQETIQDLGLADYLVDVDPDEDLSYKDALVLAMKKEKAAYRLYIDLAATAISEDITNTFLFLAQQEAKHKLRFEIEYDDIVLQED